MFPEELYVVVNYDLQQTIFISDDPYAALYKKRNNFWGTHGVGTQVWKRTPDGWTYNPRRMIDDFGNVKDVTLDDVFGAE